MLSSFSGESPRFWFWGAGAISIGLLVFSAVSFPPAWYVPANLLASGALLVVASRFGLTRRDLGLESEHVRRGVRWGLVAAGAVLLVLALGLAIPATRPLFDDARAGEIGVGLMAYRALVRIPLGTVVLEEMAFRGLLLGAWRRVVSDRVAVLASSAAFGLWHIRPALELLDANDLAAETPEKLLAVTGAIVGTTVAGVVFCWLRLKSKSLAAPALAHTAANSLATLAAFVG